MDPFKESPTGVVVSQQPDDFSGFLYNVWFPYTKTNISEIKVGSFVAVKNFDGLIGAIKYSILELVSVLPVHYAIGTSPAAIERAFPGFIIEAAKAARQDWEQSEPVEQTTKIKTTAIPVHIQIRNVDDGFVPESDESMPMIGEEVHLLTNEIMNKIVNQGIIDNNVPYIDPCWLQLNKDIKIALSTEDLLRTHFGIFGFTGSGKSNLLSTVVSQLMALKGLKILFFDLMLEYSSLLMDQLVEDPNAFILYVSEESIPGGINLIKALKGDTGSFERASRDLTRTLLVPKEVYPNKEKYEDCFLKLLEQHKIKVYSASTGGITGKNFHSTIPAFSGNLGSSKQPLTEWQNKIFDLGDNPIDQEFIQEMLDEVADFLEKGIPETFQEIITAPTETQTSFGPLKKGVSKVEINRVKMNATARSHIFTVRGLLKDLIPDPDEESTTFSDENLLSLNQLITILNDPSGNALILVQSSRDDNIRTFSSTLVNIIYNNRKSNGINEPQCLFVYDEADEFMPREARNTYADSRNAINTLARRGRKFGLGLSIATQRVAYLDTSILAQIHTYVISKLTRKYDRETIIDAFGLSDEVLKRTLRFKKGQWMLVSYEATGLEHVPLPVQFPNANTRINDFLKKIE